MKTLPFSPGRIDDLFIFRSEQDFLCVFRAGEGTWDSLCAAVAAEVVLVEDDVRSIGILKALFRLEGLAQRIAAVDPGFEILQVAVDVGLQAVLAVLFDQFDLNLRPLVGQLVLLMLANRRAAEVGVAVHPDRQVAEMRFRQAAHVRLIPGQEWFPHRGGRRSSLR